MSAALDYDFAPYGQVTVRRLVDFEEAYQLAELRVAADAIVAAFDGAVPSQIDRGLLTAEEAREQRHVLSAIAADMRTDAERRDQMRAWLKGTGPEPMRIEKMFEAQTIRAPWFDKLVALRRIIEKRRASFGEDVDKGLASPIEARAMLERLEAIHAKYWLDSFAFDGSVEDLRRHIDLLSGGSSRVEHSADQPTVAGSNPAPRSDAGATA